MISATEQDTAPILIDVVSEDITGWDIVANLGPFAILITGLIAAYLARQNLKHRRESEQRSEWWHRAQWALEAVTSDNLARKKHGMAILGHLAKSDLAGKEEAEMFQTAWQIILREDEKEPDETRNRGRWPRRARQ